MQFCTNTNTREHAHICILFSCSNISGHAWMIRQAHNTCTHQQKQRTSNQYGHWRGQRKFDVLDQSMVILVTCLIIRIYTFFKIILQAKPISFTLKSKTFLSFPADIFSHYNDDMTKFCLGKLSLSGPKVLHAKTLSHLGATNNIKHDRGLSIKGVYWAYHVPKPLSYRSTGVPLLTWINCNPSLDK